MISCQYVLEVKWEKLRNLDKEILIITLSNFNKIRLVNDYFIVSIPQFYIKIKALKRIFAKEK